jgi:septal ring factor EnvC (AmiA/AmiB activator)
LTRRSLLVISVAILLVSGAGCIVTRSSYEMKAREADSLRDALASLNRDKAKLAEENASLSKQVAACKDEEAALSSQVKAMEASLKRLGEGMPGSPQAFDGNRITRERFIDELMEREKATGSRIQNLSERTEKCERELERMRRGTAAPDR